MTRISNADHVLVLLREQLQRMGRVRAARPDRAGRPETGTARPLARLQQAAVGALLSEEDFRHLLVRAVLTEELGERAAGDPAFQAVLDDVHRILAESEDGRALMARAARQLRGAE